MLDLHSVCRFMSVENKGEVASNSEVRRWLTQSAIEVNFRPIHANDEWPMVLKSLVMFPKSQKRRATLYFDDSFTFIQMPEPQDDHVQEVPQG